MLAVDKKLQSRKALFKEAEDECALFGRDGCTLFRGASEAEDGCALFGRDGCALFRDESEAEGGCTLFMK